MRSLVLLAASASALAALGCGGTQRGTGSAIASTSSEPAETANAHVDCNGPHVRVRVAEHAVSEVPPCHAALFDGTTHGAIDVGELVQVCEESGAACVRAANAGQQLGRDPRALLAHGCVFGDATSCDMRAHLEHDSGCAASWANAGCVLEHGPACQTPAAAPPPCDAPTHFDDVADGAGDPPWRHQLLGALTTGAPDLVHAWGPSAQSGRLSDRGPLILAPFDHDAASDRALPQPSRGRVLDAWDPAGHHGEIGVLVYDRGDDANTVWALVGDEIRQRVPVSALELERVVGVDPWAVVRACRAFVAVDLRGLSGANAQLATAVAVALATDLQGTYCEQRSARTPG